MTDSDVNSDHPDTDLPAQGETDIASLNLPGASDDPATDDGLTGSNGTHGRPGDGTVR